MFRVMLRMRQFAPTIFEKADFPAFYVGITGVSGEARHRAAPDAGRRNRRSHARSIPDD
jgi:hypothetical protein